MAGEANPDAISVRIEHRAMTRAKAQRDHDLRRGPQPSYVDLDLTEHNDVLVEPVTPAALRGICEERRAQRPTRRAMRSDAAVATCGIITFGTKAGQLVGGHDRHTPAHAFRAVAEAVATRLDTTLTGLVVHRDETAIHAHFQLPAYDRRGVPLSKATRPAILSELQDVAAEAVQRCFPEVERGTRYGERIAAGASYADTVHRTVAELHRDLPRDLEAARVKLEKNERPARAAQTKAEAAETRGEGREGGQERRGLPAAGQSRPRGGRAPGGAPGRAAGARGGGRGEGGGPGPPGEGAGQGSRVDDPRPGQPGRRRRSGDERAAPRGDRRRGHGRQAQGVRHAPEGRARGPGDPGLPRRVLGPQLQRLRRPRPLAAGRPRGGPAGLRQGGRVRPRAAGAPWGTLQDCTPGAGEAGGVDAACPEGPEALAGALGSDQRWSPVSAMWPRRMEATWASSSRAELDALGADVGHGAGETGGAPRGDRVHDEVQPRGAGPGQGLGGAVAQLAQAVEEDGAGQGVAALALVEVGARRAGAGRAPSASRP